VVSLILSFDIIKSSFFSLNPKIIVANGLQLKDVGAFEAQIIL
jgi:hypothetical protein